MHRSLYLRNVADAREGDKNVAFWHVVIDVHHCLYDDSTVVIDLFGGVGNLVSC